MTRRTLLAAGAAAARASCSADLIRRVAERYRDTGVYSVVAVISGSAGGVQIRQVSSPVRHRFLTQNGLYRADYTAGDVWTWVRGSQESWVYASDLKEYRHGANNSDVGAEVLNFAADLHDRLGKRFALLANVNAAVAVVKDEDVKIAGTKRRCTILSLTPNGEAWREKLWVDPQTACVWKSVFDYPQQGTRLGGTRTTVWEQIDFAPAIPPDAFVFTPPKGSRRVDRFRAHPQAEPPPLQLPNV